MPIYRNKETGHEVTVLEGTRLPKVYEKVEAMPKGSKGADKPEGGVSDEKDGADKPKRTSSKPKGSKGADKPEGPDDKSNPETNMEENK